MNYGTGDPSMEQNSPSTAPESAAGQVCDRCRQKKIKCDGLVPSCSNCTAARTPCEVSTKLRRKTKVRGYSQSKDTLIQKLHTENSSLKEKLQDEYVVSARLRDEVGQKSQEIHILQQKLQSISNSKSGFNASQSPAMSLSTESGGAPLNPSALVIKHLGRMVFSQDGVGRFAGSTTGVHFVLSVEEAFLRRKLLNKPFTESLYHLHLVQSLPGADSVANAAGCAYPSTNSGNLIQRFKLELQLPLPYYISQINMFLERWSSLCPVIVFKQTQEGVNRLFDLFHDPMGRLEDQDYSMLYQLLLILVINCLGDQSNTYASLPSSFGSAAHYLQLSFVISQRVMARGDLSSLQGLLLLSLYVQITGQRLSMVQLNGLAVQLAQSLGLHRHARRFKFCAGEVELRKRVWWSVYILDKITSVTHGLPNLIDDADVDNDLPVDCELYDSSVANLVVPLPGEVTSLGYFLHYVRLAQILSNCLDQLYTTTRRRGGAERIASLERELRSWSQSKDCPSALRSSVIGMIIGSRIDPDPEINQLTNTDRFMASWLHLIANVVMLLTHRPGLTFDSKTIQFQMNLNACSKTSIDTITLLDENQTDWPLLTMFPSGPNLIFQSAVMIIYCHSLKNDEFRMPGAHSVATATLVTKAINLLRRYIPTSDVPNTSRTEVHTTSSSVIDAISTLEMLVQQYFQQGYDTTETMSSFLAEPGPYEPLRRQPDQLQFEKFGHPEGNEGVETWNPSALENINHLDSFDWLFGTETDAFSAMMNSNIG